MSRIFQKKFLQFIIKNQVLTILLGGLFLLPFVFWPFAPIPFEVPKVWFVCRWIELLLFFAFLRSLKKNLLNTPHLKIILIMGLFFTFALISMLIGPDLQKSLWGNYYRADGIITFIHLLGLWLFIALFWQDKWKYSISVAIVGGSFLTSIFSVIFFILIYIIGIPYLDWWNGPIGVTFGQPNYLAGYLLVTLPFITYLKYLSVSSWQKKVLSIIQFIQIFAIILTFSWACVMGVILYYILLCFSRGQRRKNISRAVIALIFLFLILIGVYAVWHGSRELNAEGRVRIFTKLLISVTKKPIFGWGWSNVDYAFDAAVWPIKYNYDVYLDKAHSILLEILVTTGVTGFINFVLFLFFVGRNLYKKIGKDNWNRTLFMVFLLYLLHSQTNAISVSEEVIFWLVAGIGTIIEA